MLSQLEKAIRLAKKTGDRLIIFESPHAEDAMVLMNFDQYEKLVARFPKTSDLTDEVMLDRINRDIAVAKDEHIFNYGEEKAGPDDYLPPLPPDPVKTGEKAPARRGGNHWTIPEQVKEGAEEIIEEDRQYLEEVPF